MLLHGPGHCTDRTRHTFSTATSFGSAASLPTVPQAMYSTFPARIKAGTTNLLQVVPSSEWYDPSSGKPLDPFSNPSHDAGGSTPYRASRASGRSRRAAAGFIRYAEAGSDDDDFEEDLGTEDEGGSSRGVKRVSMTMAKKSRLAHTLVCLHSVEGGCETRFSTAPTTFITMTMTLRAGWEERDPGTD